MPAVTSRQVKGSPLTGTEGDVAAGLPKVTQSSHGFVAGDVVRESSAGAFTQAQADSTANIGVGLSLVWSVPDTSSFVLLRSGTHRDVTLTSHGFGSFGTKLYLSQGTAGALTATEPTTGIILECGYVIDANTIHWGPGTLV